MHSPPIPTFYTDRDNWKARWGLMSGALRRHTACRAAQPHPDGSRHSKRGTHSCWDMFGSPARCSAPMNYSRKWQLEPYCLSTKLDHIVGRQMSIMAFACSPTSLWGPHFSPQIGCDGAAVLLPPKGMELGTLKSTKRMWKIL